MPVIEASPIVVSQIQDTLTARLRQDGNRDVSGLIALAKRRLPVKDAALIHFVLEDPQDAETGTDEDWFEFRQSRTSSRIAIHGTSLSALSYGLGDMYRRDCGVELLSWASRGEEFPPSYSCLGNLHVRSGRFRARVPWRYYLNQVTWSYSMSTWGWSRWEDELDWMALHGVNLALAHLGQETLWERVYRDLLGPERKFDREAFFTGTAYFSWQRMGNIQGVGTPVSDALLAAQLQLQHQILARMIDLGIAPILPAFNLYVPEQVALLSSASEMTSFWSGFTSPRYSGLQRLRPDDSLVKEISTRFMEAQHAEYATELERLPVHFYSCDLYNEMSSGDLSSVSGAFRAVFEPVRDTDAQAIFVVQMWFLAHGDSDWPLLKAKAFLDAVPRDRVIYLDLHGEKRPQWERLRPVLQDARLVWTYLHNFGGGKGLAGEMRHVKESIHAAIRTGRVQGIGLAMEGIEQNEIAYHQVLDLAWVHANAEPVEQWVRTWAAARYRLGVRPDSEEVRDLAADAWVCAFQSAYSRPQHLVGWGNTKCVLELRPAIYMRHSGFQPTAIAYAPAKLRTCTSMLARAAMKSLPNEAAHSVLSYDLVDLARQSICDKALVISTHIGHLYKHGIYEEADFARLETFARWLTTLSERMADLLDSHWMWARSSDSVDNALAGPGELADLRELFTRWSRHTALLDGYASRLTGDLARHVYIPRWQAFLQALLRGENGKGRGMRVEFAKIVDDFVQKAPHLSSLAPTSPEQVLALLKELETMDAASLLRMDAASLLRMDATSPLQNTAANTPPFS
ncbi:Alpha-N-acetylglucosaminidase [Hondaea fermentalgiana]|uniref:Alpha-N-acetylglucosaminidase n=1 Tax=Hondaea fermentalgiana TaxID=2315210 RepID=A0A2R5FYV7_9STRA|nr:Alpha-N-acetylglucosaminidase [Hondaea fermentalgiana]|eukprot:GBG23910.1 Alpha-N-acetylglucosaminidase [Hondaea fermentalgiana]